MNCVLFVKMDNFFSLENRTLKKYWKMAKKYWKSQGKVREFYKSGKVGTLSQYEPTREESMNQLFSIFFSEIQTSQGLEDEISTD